MSFSHSRSKKTFLNRRSLSLPTALQHPSVSDFNESLSNIITSSSLTGLTILYSKIENFLTSPHTQKVMKSQQGHANERVLDSYIRILDACVATRDIVSQTKHEVQQLLSALRRKDSTNGIRSYEASRKTSRKTTREALRELRIGFKSSKQKEQENIVYMMIKEAESVTVFLFKFWLSYVIMDKDVGPSRKRSWSSFVSKKTNEVEIDPSRLKEMESNTRILEEELERLFRQLIKTRVSLLNALNH